MWLIARISTDGRDTVERFSLGHQRPGEPRFLPTREWLLRHGYEIRAGFGGVARADRAAWPFLVIAYKSRNREGIGRLGGQYMTWAARKVS